MIILKKDALLMLHDCLMFGLNNSPKYEQKLASSYFLKAIDLFQPEAMSFMAKETFIHLKTLMANKKRSTKDLDTICKEKLKEFLEWFEKAAYLGLISMDQVEYLKKNDLFSFVPDQVMDLIKRREEICLGDEIISNIILCSNRQCME